MTNLEYLYSLAAGSYLLGNNESVRVSSAAEEKIILIQTNKGFTFITLFKKAGKVGHQFGLNNYNPVELVNYAVNNIKPNYIIFNIAELTLLFSFILTVSSTLYGVFNQSAEAIYWAIYFTLIFLSTLAYLGKHKND